MEFLVGLLIATAVGLTGVGAGTVTAPILVLAFGLSPADSVGTALAFAAIVKLAVLPVYLRNRQIGFRPLGLLCAGGIPGVILGATLVDRLNARRHENILFLLMGSTIMVTALYNLYRAFRAKHIQAQHDGSRWLPPIAAIIGSEVGFSSAGAGALGSLALLQLTSLTPAQVVGTDVVFGLILSLIGGGMHVFAGHYDSAMLLRLAAGGVAGALAGANLSSLLPARPMRAALSVCLSALGAGLCWRALG